MLGKVVVAFLHQSTKWRGIGILKEAQHWNVFHSRVEQPAGVQSKVVKQIKSPDTDTQFANFQGNPLCQATKQYLKNS